MGAAVNCTGSWYGCSRGMGTGRWIEMSYISMAAVLWIAGAVVGLVSTRGTEWQSEKSPLLPAAQTVHKDNRGPRARMRWSAAWSFSLCNCIKWFRHSLIVCVLSLSILLFWIMASWCNAFILLAVLIYHLQSLPQDQIDLFKNDFSVFWLMSLHIF